MRPTAGRKTRREVYIK